MADPYEWSDERDERARRYDPREDDARRAAERRAEQERQQRADYERPSPERPSHRDLWERERASHLNDFAASRDDEAFYEGYGEPRRGPREHPRDHEHRSFEGEARHAGRSVARGWRKLSEGVRHAFEDERGPQERDPRRGGGMFGGQDRRGALFSHDDGLSGRRLGPHRGKGPSGYVRDDSRILEEICDRLTENDHLDACNIEVKIDAGEVTLNGQVARREDKRLAEDIAESVSGVKHLQNNLRVKPFVEPAQDTVRKTAPQPSPQAAAPQPRAPSDAPAPTSAQITDQSKPN
jgi:BON domain